MQGNWHLIIFFIFSAITLFSAVMVVLQTNPVRCVLFLVLAFIAAAGLWMLQEAEFLSLILILVYVGAVMTLFLFVVMMLNIDREARKHRLSNIVPFALILAAFVTGLFFVAIPDSFFKQASSDTFQMTVPTIDNRAIDTQPPAKVSNTEALGAVLYTDYLLAFESAAVILLAAIIAAITLAHRTRQGSKKQDTLRQLTVTRADRLSLIAMKSEKD